MGCHGSATMMAITKLRACQVVQGRPMRRSLLCFCPEGTQASINLMIPAAVSVENQIVADGSSSGLAPPDGQQWPGIRSSRCLVECGLPTTVGIVVECPCESAPRTPRPMRMQPHVSLWLIREFARDDDNCLTTGRHAALGLSIVETGRVTRIKSE